MAVRRRSIFIFLLALACAQMRAIPRAEARQEPILVLDPGGHTSRVNQVLFTPDGRSLISVANDKVIRIWDLAPYGTVRTLRTQIGRGIEGEIYAAAIHPEGQILAVGGAPAGTAAGEAPIALYDLETGKIKRLLAGHRGNIVALAFSRDGAVLASGSADDTVRLWDGATFRPLRALKGHKGDVYGIAFSPDGRQLASASHDRTVRIWSVADGRRLRELSHGKERKHEVQCVAWSPDGKTLASGSLDHTLRLWDPNTGELRRTLMVREDQVDQGNQVDSLAFSPDGRYLVSGLGGDPRGSEFTVRVWEMPEGRLLTEFKEHHSTVMSVAIAPDATRPLVASAGEDPRELYLWNPLTWNPLTSKVERQLAGTEASVWAVAWSPDGSRIAWGNTKPEGGDDAEAALEHTYDLRIGWPGPDVNPGTIWQRAARERGGRRLAFLLDSDGRKVGVTVREGDREVVRIRRISRQKHDEVRCFTFTPDDGFIVGSLFSLVRFDATGRRQQEFVGHTGQVTDVAISRDSKFLASAALDQTVRIWPLDGKEKTVRPLLSMLMGLDREWVAWTPEGYYACSLQGDHMVGWQINRGVDRAPDFYSAYQFRARFFRPEVIHLLLQAGTVQRAVQLADREGSRSRTDSRYTARNIRAFAPPAIQIISPKPDELVTGTEVVVKARISDPNGRRINPPKFRVEGRPRGLDEVQQDGAVYTQRQEVVPGKQRVAVTVTNDAGAENTATIDVRGITRAAELDQDPPEEKPDLYLLAIGVSRYPQGFPSLKFARNDAEDFVKLYREQEGKLFRRVFVYEDRALVDTNATLTRIRGGLDWLCSRTRSQDYVAIFAAGHGLSIRPYDRYCFVPFDADAQALADTTVEWNALAQRLGRLKPNVLLVLDTCHAGVCADPKNKALREAINEANLIVFTSCKPEEVSMETPSNGYFTKALLEVLRGKEKSSDIERITLAAAEAYVYDTVLQRTYKEQHQAQRPAVIHSLDVSGELPLASLR